MEALFELSPVIPALFILAVLLFTLFFERLHFYYIGYKGFNNKNLEPISTMEFSSWIELAINRKDKAVKIERLRENLKFIEGLIKVSTLLGLLGTVFGIITLFETLSLESTKETLFYGIYRATVPTMIGISISIIGLFLVITLKRIEAKREKELY